MTHRYMKKDTALPVWAALIAPLVGVPLMVALVALAAPEKEAPAVDPVPAAVSEPVDTHGVGTVSRDSAPQLEPELSVS